jgi:homocysteine S-methyltransferase
MTPREPALPQLQGGRYLTDGGIETVLIFHDRIELPEFAAFTLLRRDGGFEQLRRYYRRYLDLTVRQERFGFILESPTWRASQSWGARLGFDAAAMRQINLDAIALMHQLRDEYVSRLHAPIVVSGCVGPRGDGYVAGAPMSPEDAREAHQLQVDALVTAGVDMIAAITMTTSAEAIGVARATAQAGCASAISFTVETDGRLPSGETLAAAIDAVERDLAESQLTPPAYYMINCAHPTHFESTLDQLGDRRARIRGLRANASKLSHAELDAATELDDGNPSELAEDYHRLLTRLPALAVFGGCCGTDHRHVEQIARRVEAEARV